MSYDLTYGEINNTCVFNFDVKYNMIAVLNHYW